MSLKLRLSVVAGVAVWVAVISGLSSGVVAGVVMVVYGLNSNAVFVFRGFVIIDDGILVSVTRGVTDVK